MTLTVRGKVYTAKFTDQLFPIKTYARGSRLLQLMPKSLDDGDWAAWDKQWLEFCGLVFEGDVSGLSLDLIESADYSEIVRFFTSAAERTTRKLLNGTESSSVSSPAPA